MVILLFIRKKLNKISDKLLSWNARGFIMKKTNFIKFTLDIIMGFIFALLFNKSVLGGLSFHETAGLTVGFAVLVHIILNWKWVKNVTLSIFNKKIVFKTRIGYILNILLLLDIAMIIISGVSISKVITPGLGIQNNLLNQRTHIALAYLALTLIGIHIGLHWKWVMNVFKKILNVSKVNKISVYIAKIAVVLVLAFGIYSMVSVNYFSKITIGAPAAFEQNQRMRIDSQFQGLPQNEKGINGADQNKGRIDASNGKINRQDNFQGHGREMRNGKEIGSANILNVLITYLSIMGVFTILTYYIEKLLLSRKTA